MKDGKIKERGMTLVSIRNRVDFLKRRERTGRLFARRYEYILPLVASDTERGGGQNIFGADLADVKRGGCAGGDRCGIHNV